MTTSFRIDRCNEIFFNLNELVNFIHDLRDKNIQTSYN